MRISEIFQEDVKIWAEKRGVDQSVELGRIQEGELSQQKEREIALKILGNYMSVATVSEITSLSEDQIRAICSKSITSIF